MKTERERLERKRKQARNWGWRKVLKATALREAALLKAKKGDR